MSQKFLKWRVTNKHSGIITVPEVARFTQEVLFEAKDIWEIKKR